MSKFRLGIFIIFIMFSFFNLSEKDIIFSTIDNNEFLTKGDKINKIDILFKKIDKHND